nr:reverse transcriptase domain-containing protein [Tanacetum cinerariifolium]GEZ52662.1 reverse transcriptase domain-containing protein [Tanacetum cinerariifolium]
MLKTTEIYGIKKRHDEGLQAFMDRFKSESSHIKGVPPVLCIFAFMHSHGHLKLAKKLNHKIPKTMDEMFERVRAFIKGEVADGSTEMVRPSQGDKGYIRLAWTEGPERARNRGGPREARRNMGRGSTRMQTPGKSTRIVKGGTVASTRRTNVQDKGASRENAKEAFTVSLEHPDHYVMIETTLTTNYRQLLVDALLENREIANTMPIKLASGTWKVQVDYSSINKVCAKDMYPLSEEGEGLASLMGYPYKCFLRLPKEYSQIRMTEGDEEKTGFHTEEGDQKKTKQVANVGHPKRRRRSNAMSSAKKQDNKFCATGRKERNPNTCFLFFRKHKVKVVTDGPMEETLKLAKRERRLGKWATEIRTYDISYVQRKEAEGPVVKKFFGQGEQVEETPNANKVRIFSLSKGFQANSTSTTRA